MLLVIAGLLISVPLVVWGSTLVLALLRRYPAIVYVGAGAIAWTAGRMIAHDHLLAAWFDARPRWLRHMLEAALVILVCGIGWLMQRRREGGDPRGVTA